MEKEHTGSGAQDSELDERTRGGGKVHRAGSFMFTRRRHTSILTNDCMRYGS